MSRNPFLGKSGRYVMGLAAAVLLAVVSSTVTAAIVGSRQSMEVSFVFVSEDAKSVSLAGDFNGWATDTHELKKTGPDGSWTITVKLHKGRAYNYNFVVDGTRWVVDPQSPFSIDDGIGGSVSSLIL